MGRRCSAATFRVPHAPVPGDRAVRRPCLPRCRARRHLASEPGAPHATALQAAVGVALCPAALHKPVYMPSRCLPASTYPMRCTSAPIPPKPKPMARWGAPQPGFGAAAHVHCHTVCWRRGKRSSPCSAASSQLQVQVQLRSRWRPRAPPVQLRAAPVWCSPGALPAPVLPRHCRAASGSLPRAPPYEAPPVRSAEGAPPHPPWGPALNSWAPVATQHVGSMQGNTWESFEGVPTSNQHQGAATAKVRKSARRTPPRPCPQAAATAHPVDLTMRQRVTRVHAWRLPRVLLWDTCWVGTAA